MIRASLTQPALILVFGAAATLHAQAGEPKKAVADSQYVDMSPVGLPVISQGRVVNYVFVTLKITLSPRADGAKLREKEPYFRDALVRLAYRSPFNRQDDFNRVDDQALKSKMFVEAVRIVGPGLVTGVQVIKELPQNTLMRPSPATPKSGSAN